MILLDARRSLRVSSKKRRKVLAVPTAWWAWRGRSPDEERVRPWSSWAAMRLGPDHRPDAHLVVAGGDGRNRPLHPENRRVASVLPAVRLGWVGTRESVGLARSEEKRRLWQQEQ